MQLGLGITNSTPSLFDVQDSDTGEPLSRSPSPRRSPVHRALQAVSATPPTRALISFAPIPIPGAVMSAQTFSPSRARTPTPFPSLSPSFSSSPSAAASAGSANYALAPITAVRTSPRDDELPQDENAREAASRYPASEDEAYQSESIPPSTGEPPSISAFRRRHEADAQPHLTGNQLVDAGARHRERAGGQLPRIGLRLPHPSVEGPPRRRSDIWLLMD